MKPPDWDRLLLAYADGELRPHEREHVERYLAANPGAWDLLAELEETGPANFEFWDSVEPPVPSDDDWDRRSQAISVLVPQRRRWAKAGAASLAACAAFAVVALLILPDAPKAVPPMALGESRNPATNDDPLADFAVLPIATADDAMVIAIRGGRDTGLVSVKSPLADVLALATPDDVEIEDPGDAEIHEGDAAMMYWPKK